MEMQLHLRTTFRDLCLFLLVSTFYMCACSINLITIKCVRSALNDAHAINTHTSYLSFDYIYFSSRLYF